MNSASVFSSVSLYLGQLGCVSSSDGTPCDTPLSQASRVKRRNKKKRPITIGSTTIIPLKGAETWNIFYFVLFYGMFRVRNLSSSARVTDPHNLPADPNPAFHWNVENADPDSAPYQSYANLRPLVYRPSWFHFVSPRLHYERSRHSTAPF
jgi:hypothetical protein